MFAPVLRACCVIGLLTICSAGAADKKPSLIGATREEVLARFGEPKSQITVGTRQVLFFTGERIVLRDNRVIEAEEVPVEATPAKPASSESATAETASTESPTTPPVADATKPGTPAAPAPSPESQAEPTASAPAEPEVVIKSVRPPSKDDLRPSAVRSASAAAPIGIPSVVSSSTNAAPAGKEMVGSPARSSVVGPVPTDTAKPTGPTQTPSTPVVPAAGTPSSVAGGPAGIATAKASVTSGSSSANATASTATRVVQEEPPSTVSKGGLSPLLYGGVAAVVAIIVGFFVWRGRQRKPERVATAVSRSPFAPAGIAVGEMARFTSELLDKIEWRRFEQLVVAYYNKTGVVASSAKGAPGSPVSVRISWKGEQRPFACVHCIAHPSAPVEAKPVQALYDVLVAEGVRRGYVVTSGKFEVSARDLAEQKQITLLSGDVFLEKLNALPDPVRAELFRDATVGDYTTPTCARCETKMRRAPDDPELWQCPQCGSEMPRS